MTFPLNGIEIGGIIDSLQANLIVLKDKPKFEHLELNFE
jgi:hypothetical protein